MIYQKSPRLTKIPCIYATFMATTQWSLLHSHKRLISLYDPIVISLNHGSFSHVVGKMQSRTSCIGTSSHTVYLYILFSWWLWRLRRHWNQQLSWICNVCICWVYMCQDMDFFVEIFGKCLTAASYETHSRCWKTKTNPQLGPPPTHTITPIFAMEEIHTIGNSWVSLEGSLPRRRQQHGYQSDPSTKIRKLRSTGGKSSHFVHTVLHDKWILVEGKYIHEMESP